ncbi:hypothetical protein MASR2M47_25490 [Draconibacterium sp.]|jgi:hypothetical protein
MNAKSNEYYDKKIDNELKKKELEKKHGAHFSGNSEIPLELESAWLNSIEAFEQQYVNAKKITVYEFLGKPQFRKIDELQPNEIPVELERLNDVDSFEIISNEIKSIEINPEETDAVLNFNIAYKGLFYNSKETFDFKGDAKFKLKPSQYGGWEIYHIDMPGLMI